MKRNEKELLRSIDITMRRRIIPANTMQIVIKEARDGDMALFAYIFQDIPIAPKNVKMNKVQGEKLFEMFKNEGPFGSPELRYSRQFVGLETWSLPRETLVYPKKKIMISRYDDCIKILHHHEVRSTLVKAFYEFVERNKPSLSNAQIWVLSSNGARLHHEELDLTAPQYDLHKCYNDQVVDSYQEMRTEIASSENGLWIVHGEPGTGKTSLLRHLALELDKPMLFLSPALASEMDSPSLIKYFISNPGLVLIIEDAEELLLDRKLGGNPIVSTLLNITDGLLADALKIKVICTMNALPERIDKALLRPGRLKRMIHVGRLEATKADQLLDQLNRPKLNKGLTLAEVFHPKIEPNISNNNIGFRDAS